MNHLVGCVGCVLLICVLNLLGNEKWILFNRIRETFSYVRKRWQKIKWNFQDSRSKFCIRDRHD